MLQFESWIFYTINIDSAKGVSKNKYVTLNYTNTIVFTLFIKM